MFSAKLGYDFWYSTSWKVDGLSPKGTYRGGSGMQGRASTTSLGRTEADGSLKGGTWSLSLAGELLLLVVRFMCEIQSPFPSEHLKRTAPCRLPVFVKTKNKKQKQHPFPGVQ